MDLLSAAGAMMRRCCEGGTILLYVPSAGVIELSDSARTRWIPQWLFSFVAWDRYGMAQHNDIRKTAFAHT